MLQKVRTVLIPELGLDLEPEFINEFEVNTEFSRVLAHVVGRTGNRSIIIRATSDGRLLVAAAGTSMEVYAVETGDAEDAYAAADTFEFVDAQYLTDIMIETHPAQISFRNAAGIWGDDKIILVGAASIDFLHYGIRVQNRGAGNVADYEITTYR